METIKFDEFSNLLASAVDLQDVFYIVEGSAVTIEKWIAMKKGDMQRVRELLNSDQVLRLSDPTKRADFNKRLVEIGIQVQNIAQVSGLPPMDEYQAEGVKVLRTDGKDLVAAIKDFPFISQAKTVVTPGLRDLVVAVGGENYTVQVSDELHHVNYDYNPAVFFIKSSAMVMAVLRDLTYSVVNGQHEAKSLLAFHDEAKTFANSHYYGNMNYEYQLARFNAVMETATRVRQAAHGGINNFVELEQLMGDPLVLLKKATDYIKKLEAVNPSAPIHPSVKEKFKSLYLAPGGSSNIYMISHVVREFHKFFNGPKENVLATGSDFSKAVVATMLDRIKNSPGLAAIFQANVLLDASKYDRFIVAGRPFGVSLNNEASAGPLYKDYKHSIVGLSEVAEASSMMLYLGQQYDHPLCNNIPMAGSPQAMTQLINERRVYELKPKAEVYSIHKHMIRNIMAGTYAKEIPMSIFNQLTRKFNRHLLADPKTHSMLRMPLTHGGADLWLKNAIHQLRRNPSLPFILYTMADNYYIFYRVGGSIRMASTDVRKAEGCVHKLCIFASNLKTVYQLGLSHGIKTVTKEAVSQLLRDVHEKKGAELDDALEDAVLDIKFVLNVRKKERRLEKQGKIKQMREQRRERKDVGVYETTMVDPFGWIYYNLFFYPFTAADVNVLLRQQHFFCTGMPSGIVNTAYYNNDKSGYAYDDVEKAVKRWLRKYENFDYGMSYVFGRTHTEVLEEELNSHEFMRGAELAMTVEADVQITSPKEYDLDAKDNEDIGVADVLGFDLRLVDPEDGFPSMYIPVLRKSSLFGILMFQKFERKFAGQPDSPDLTLAKNLMLVINLKVAYFVGGWAYRYISLWIRMTLRRIYLNYPDLRATLARVADEQIIDQAKIALDYENQQFQDLLGLTLVDVIRHPNVSLDLVWRVYGHGKGAYYDDQDRIIAPNLVRRIFKDYVPVTDEEYEMNTIAMMARGMQAPPGRVGSEPGQEACFQRCCKMYFGRLDGVTGPGEGAVFLIAGGNSFEERMSDVTEGIALMDIAEGAVVPDDIDEALYQAQIIPPRGPRIGSTAPAGVLATDWEPDVEELTTHSKLFRGKFEPPRMETTKVKYGNKKGVTPTLVPEVQPDRIGYVLKWARAIPKMLRAGGPGGQPKPGPLRELFAEFMPQFVNPASDAPYDNDRHLTKIAIMRLLRQAERVNDRAITRDGNYKYPHLVITRDEFSAAEKHQEASAGKTKRYNQLPPKIEEAKLPKETMASFQSFFNKVAPKLNVLMGEVFGEYVGLTPGERKKEDEAVIQSVIAEDNEPVVVHATVPVVEEPKYMWTTVLDDENSGD